MKSLRPVEISVEDFIIRYEKAAATGKLYSQIESSPLLEFCSEGEVFYLLDRTGPYHTPSDLAQVIINVLIEPHNLRLSKDKSVFLQNVGVSSLYGRGKIIAQDQISFIVESQLPLVFSFNESVGDYKIGDWIEFETQPPLHGFIVHK